MAWAGLAALIVWWVRRRVDRRGVAIGTAGLLYGLGRLVLDGFRADAVRFGMTGSQWTGLLMLTTSLVVLGAAMRRRAAASDEASDEEPAEVAG